MRDQRKRICYANSCLCRNILTHQSERSSYICAIISWVCATVYLLKHICPVSASLVLWHRFLMDKQCQWLHTNCSATDFTLFEKRFLICSQLDYTSLVRWTNISSIIPQSTINWKSFFFLLPHLFAKNDLVEKISANVSTGKDRDRQTGIRANTSQQISQILAHNHMVAVVSSSQTSRLRSIRN